MTIAVFMKWLIVPKTIIEGMLLNIQRTDWLSGTEVIHLWVLIDKEQIKQSLKQNLTTEKIGNIEYNSSPSSNQYRGNVNPENGVFSIFRHVTFKICIITNCLHWD